MLSFVLSPHLLTVAGSDFTHVGIAPGTLRVETFAVVLVGALAVTARRSSRAWIRVGFISFLVCLIVGLSTWGFDARHLSGAVNLAFAWLAFLLGARLASDGWRSGRQYRSFSWAIASLLVIETAVSAAQNIGVNIHFRPESANVGIADRSIGTFDHPGTLGKFCALWLLLALPGLRSSDKTQRRLSAFIIFASLAASGFTEARANTVALIASLFIWSLLGSARANSVAASRRPLSGRRLIFGAATILFAVPAAVTSLERFAVDAHGGSRGHFLAVGLPFVRSNLVRGLGVNSYVEVVGQVDRLTRLGYPIHNAFLLLIAELGLVPALAFFLPIIVTTGACLKRIGVPGEARLWSRAYVACLPGLLLIAATGWGMAADTTVVCWLFTTGFVYGAATAPVASHVTDNRNLSVAA